MFQNRAEDLRKFVREYPEAFDDRVWLYTEMANINDGIAEILAIIKPEPKPIPNEWPDM